MVSVTTALSAIFNGSFKTISLTSWMPNKPAQQIVVGSFWQTHCGLEKKIHTTYLFLDGTWNIMAFKALFLTDSDLNSSFNLCHKLFSGCDVCESLWFLHIKISIGIPPGNWPLYYKLVGVLDIFGTTAINLFIWRWRSLPQYEFTLHDLVCARAAR